MHLPIQIMRDDAKDLGIGGTPYEFVRLIGSGASAEVFEVRDACGKRWALKLLRAGHAIVHEARARFVREARALVSIYHPNLVPIVDAGSSGGRPYFTMPLLDGETVRERMMRAGPLRASEACAVMMDVLSGLDAAHREGIVHRDVKPTNVFLTKDSAIVLDFGVAKILHDGVGDVTTGKHILGTPRYLAPEQILGGAVDGRTDVYAAGIMMFELITGQDPFGAAGAAAQMRAHVFGKPARLRDYALVSAELDDIVARAIERVPEHRFRSAVQFGCAIAKCRARYLRAPDLRRSTKIADEATG